MDDLEILEQKAIDAAINLDWQEAIKLNKKIVSRNKKAFQGYLRLGFAYLQNNKFSQAKKIYKKVLKMQPGNQIANENLEKIKILDSQGSKKFLKTKLNFDPNLFLEIPGKTKSAALVKLGQKNILAHLTIGQVVYLKPKRRRIEIRTNSNEYVGSLPDDLSKNLFIFIKAGSEYAAYIKEVSLNRVVVFVTEEKKAKKYQKYSSFPKDINKEITRVSLDEEASENSEEEDNFTSDLDNLAEALHEEKESTPYKEEDFEDEENTEE